MYSSSSSRTRRALEYTRLYEYWSPSPGYDYRFPAAPEDAVNYIFAIVRVFIRRATFLRNIIILWWWFIKFHTHTHTRTLALVVYVIHTHADKLPQPSFGFSFRLRRVLRSLRLTSLSGRNQILRSQCNFRNPNKCTHKGHSRCLIKREKTRK